MNDLVNSKPTLVQDGARELTLGNGARELTTQELASVGGGNWFSDLWSETFHPISESKADAAGIKTADGLVRRAGDGSVGPVTYRLIGYDLGWYKSVATQLFS
jgi:hypothetical protein